MMYIKYGIENKGSTGYSMHRINLDDAKYYELMDSINALIIQKLKKEKVIKDNRLFVLIESFVYM